MSRTVDKVPNEKEIIKKPLLLQVTKGNLMKKIIFTSVIILFFVFGILIVGNIEDTAIQSGVLKENNMTETINIKITRTNFDKIFNKISRDIMVEGNNINYQYKCSGTIFDMEGYYAVPVRRMDMEGLASQGYLYFDNKMKNFVIETMQENIYSANNDFIDMVIKQK